MARAAANTDSKHRFIIALIGTSCTRDLQKSGALWKRVILSWSGRRPEESKHGVQERLQRNRPSPATFEAKVALTSERRDIALSINATHRLHAIISPQTRLSRMNPRSRVRGSSDANEQAAVRPVHNVHLKYE